MTEKVRLNLHISPELERRIDEMAQSYSTTRTEVVRRALVLMKLTQEAEADGRHIGFVKDRAKLDTEIVGLW